MVLARPVNIRNTTEYYEIVIQPRFAGVGNFSEGVAAAMPYIPIGNRRAGFIDQRGRWAIRPRYLGVQEFRDGVAAVIRRGYHGVIDRNGRTVIPFEHDNLFYIDDGLFWVMRRYEMPDIWWSSRLHFEEGLLCVSGREIAPLGKYEMIMHFHGEGLLSVRRDGKMGFIDFQGNEVIPPQFDWGHPFQEGLAMVTLDDLSGFIDVHGNEVIPLQFGSALAFSDGLAAVMVGGRWGFINPDGEMVIAPQFEYVGAFSEGFAPVGMNAEISVAHETDSSLGEEFESTRRVLRWGFIDREGNVVVPMEFDGVQNFSSGVATVHMLDIDSRGSITNQQAALIDQTGAKIVPFGVYESMSITDEAVIVRIPTEFGTGLVGVIDTTGRVIVPPRFDHISPASEGLMAVSYNRRWGFIRVNL